MPSPISAARCAWAARNACSSPIPLVRRIYGQERIIERHRHRYEVNNHYLPRLKAAGLKVSGVSAKDGLCEMIELPGHPVVRRLPVSPRIHLDPASRTSAVQGVHAGCVRPGPDRAGRRGGRCRAVEKHRLSGSVTSRPRRSQPAPAPRCGDRSSRDVIESVRLQAGLDQPLFLIAGPCVVESRSSRSTPPANSRKSALGWGCLSSTNRPTTRPTGHQ